MFTASMVGAFSFMLLTIAIVDKVVQLSIVGTLLLMVAIFMGIKAECERMDKDRKYEDKINELEKELKDIILNIEMDNG